MRILANTPTGNTGRAVVHRLLAAGHDVTALARDPAKLGDLAAHVRVVKGSVEDPAALDQAFAGADAVYWVTPPLASPQYVQWNAGVARGAVAAAKRAGTGKAVLLSSVSAQVPAGVGPISSLFGVENAFTEGFQDLVVLRPGFFMENHFASLATIGAMGAIFAPIPGHVRFPQIASRDVAEAAAGFLARGFSGRQVAGLHGPADLSFDDTAAIVGQAIGRPVTFIAVSVEQGRAAMLGMGLPAYAADAYLEMYDAIATGRFMQAEPRTAATTTPTTMAQFAADTLKPAMMAAKG